PIYIQSQLSSIELMQEASIIPILKRDQTLFHPVVPFDPGADQFYPFDFTDRNTGLSAKQIKDTDQFAHYIQSMLILNNCRYGIGGYNEHRTLYERSNHFDKDLNAPGQSKSAAPAPEADPRRLHLGTDIWGPVGTRVFSPLDGIIHSFAFNNHFGDYGATIILTHLLQ